MFKEAIKKTLQNKERNQSWLADKVGFARQSVYFYLREGKGMVPKRVEKMCEFLGITMNVPKD